MAVAQVATTNLDSIFQSVGRQYGIDPNILKTIGIKESSLNPNIADNHNSNGTIDVGLMQINSGDGGWNQARLRSDPTYSVEAAAQTILQKKAMLKGMGQDPNNPFNIFKAYNGWNAQGAQYAQDALNIYKGGVGQGGMSLKSLPSPLAGKTGNLSDTATSSSGGGSTSIFDLGSNLQKGFFLLLGGALIVVGILVATNPMGNLSNVLDKVTEKGVPIPV